MRIDATIISSHMGDVYSGEQNDLRFFLGLARDLLRLIAMLRRRSSIT